MKVPFWVKLLFGLAALAAMLAAASWLAGVVFFLLSKADPLAAKVGVGTWWSYWQHYQLEPEIAKRLKFSAFLGVIGGVVAPSVALVYMFRESRSLHGEARFATAGEIQRAGLIGKPGIIVGKRGNKFLTFGGLQFVLLAAPTRSGKGVGIVVPNLLEWPDSVVVLDVKQENFKITSKYRAAHGQEVYLFNPFADDGVTHRQNPLAYISDDPRKRVTEILGIGRSLYPGEGRDAFFDDAARNLFLGLCLYLCETPALPRTLGELLRQSSGKGLPVKDYLNGLVLARNYRPRTTLTLIDIGKQPAKVIALVEEMGGMDPVLFPDMPGLPRVQAVEGCNESTATVPISPPLTPELAEAFLLRLQGAGAVVDPVSQYVRMTQWDGEGLPMLSDECVDALNRFTTTSDNTLASIMATFNTPLTLWASPIVDAATSCNDFDLRDVRKKRMTIYLGIPANKLGDAELLLNIFFNQLVNLNTDHVLHSKPELKHVCLLLMDEFTAPGRIFAIDKANAFIAGYGLRLLTIIQSPGQLEAEPRKGYGREGARTLITNHALQILFTPRVQQDAREYSDMLGHYTFRAKGTSRQLGDGKGGHSVSISDQKRPLMFPQELMAMSQNEQIINLENTKPIHCEKIRFYADPVFMDRLKKVSPRLRALGKKLPDKALLDAVWGSGELSARVPVIDFDLHEAIVQGRSRELTADDVVTGIDLRRLALDPARLAAFKESASDDTPDVPAMVNNFFAMLESGQLDDGADKGEADGSEAITEAERAELDRDAAAELDDEADTAQEIGSAVVLVVREPTREFNAVHEVAADDETGDAIADTADWDDFMADAGSDDGGDASFEVPPDDYFPGDEPADEGLSRPALDLSILDRASNQNE